MQNCLASQQNIPLIQINLVRISPFNKPFTSLMATPPPPLMQQYGAVIAPQDLLRKPQHSATENWALCQGCTQCCEYVCLEIDRPTSMRDVDHVIWYLIHQNIWVWVDDAGKWYVQFNTSCQYLSEEGSCSWYTQRPKICQDYKQSECPRYSAAAAEKFLFKNAAEFMDWLAQHRNKRMRLLHARYLARCAVRWHKTSRTLWKMHR